MPRGLRHPGSGCGGRAAAAAAGKATINRSVAGRVPLLLFRDGRIA